MFMIHAVILPITILFFLGFSTASFAVVSEASRSPATADSSTPQTVNAHDVIDLNPTGEVITDTTGYLTRTQMYVNPELGIFRGYAGMSRGAGISADTPQAFASGSMAGSGWLSGTGTDLVHIVAQLNFDGSFNNIQGKPLLQLVGDLQVISTPPGGKPLPGILTTFHSQLSFATFDGGKTVHVDQVGTGSTAPQVLNSDPSHLRGVAQVSFDAIPGSLINLGATLAGYANPEFGFAATTSAGAVDFLHTGGLQLVLPDGYSFSGMDLLLNNIVTTIPEPEAYALFLAGLGLVGYIGRRRRQ